LAQVKRALLIDRGVSPLNNIWISHFLDRLL